MGPTDGGPDGLDVDGNDDGRDVVGTGLVGPGIGAAFVTWFNNGEKKASQWLLKLCHKSRTTQCIVSGVF